MTEKSKALEDGSRGSGGPLEEYREDLESLAVGTWLSIMGNELVDPKVRLDTTNLVMKALGKDAPPRTTNPTINFNFGSGVKEAVSGIDMFQRLLDRPASDQSTKIISEEE